ncbi:MAG: hypothetical protein MK200_05290, partial [Nitrosopumilus sp.]|nr:hypothetical protein [Nitrosopumilus sp.]
MIYRTLRDKDSATSSKTTPEINKGNNQYTKEKKFNAHLVDNANRKDQTICSFCGKDDHVASNGPYGKKLIQYFSCKKFAEMLPEQRYLELKKKDLCTQCLFPGASGTSGKHAEGKCQNIYTCKHNSHDNSVTKKHILVCNEHCKDNANKSLLEEYRSRCIRRNNNLPDYAKSIKVSFHSNSSSVSSMMGITSKSNSESSDDSEIMDSGIFIFQEICVDNNLFCLFFDGGCGDLVSRYNAVERLGKISKKQTNGPISLGGVGNINVESPYGIYQISLPLYNGRNAIMSGTVIDEVASEFPTYPLSKVQKDIQEAYIANGGNVEDLPKLPQHIGGQVDFILGIKYLRYHPQKIFSMPSGLTIYRSSFLNVDGSRGVVGGPHETFTAINDHYSCDEVFTFKHFLSNQTLLYKAGYQVNPDLKFLETKSSKDNSQDLLLNIKNENSCKGMSCSCLLVSRNQKIFNAVENAASEITYRCVTCRDCKECKNNESIELISMKDEVEQTIINKSVIIDLENNITIARLPFLEDPVINLKPNIDKAKAVYGAQLRNLSKDQKSKDDVIESEKKLQSLGFVDYVKNLTQDEQRMLQESAIQYYIPWRAVWNSNSLSTPCRLV